MSSFGDLDSRLFQADALCVRRAPNGNENVSSFQPSGAGFVFNFQLYTLSRNAFDTQNVRAQQNVNPLVAKQFENRLGNIRVFFWCELR
jgi:hypothetical protein